MATPPKQSECVKVVVRCRPLSTKEVSDGRQRIVDINTKKCELLVKNPKGDPREPPKAFTFDHVYDWESSQEGLYNECSKPIVDSVLAGYNGTIFAYGQTGTGKTHTMEGKEDDDQKGIIPRAFQHIFKEIENLGDRDFLVRASFLEIYNEDIRDLLSKNPHAKLELKETVDTGVYVKDLTTFVVKGVKEISNVLQVGKKNRTVGATLMNQDSSRSHSIFAITVETSDRGSDGHIRVGKLNLVDLAGSERQSKTGATGDRLKEATKINLSLSALGNVISALVDGKSSHIPYRDSKLTRLLQDSLGGNTKTVMVANIGPADYNFDETMSTLRYANRAKNIKNKPRINEDPKDAMLREFQAEIARLKAQLEAEGPAVASAVTGPPRKKVVEKVIEKERDITDQELDNIREQARQELQSLMKGKMMDAAEAETARKAAEEKAQERMRRLLSEKEHTDEEKLRIAEAMKAQDQELQEYSSELAVERKKREDLLKKLQAMEGNVLHSDGQGTLLEKTEKLEEEARQQEDMLLEKRQLEEENQRRIAELEEMQLIAEEQYASVQDEIEMKTKKLKKLHGNYQRLKVDLNDQREGTQREREELLDSIRALTQQIKLKDMVIASYIPPEVQHKIVQRAHWDETSETWMIERVEYAGNNIKGKQLKPEHKRTNSALSNYVDSSMYGWDEESMEAAINQGMVNGMMFQPSAGDVSETLASVYFSYKEETELYDEQTGQVVKRPASARRKPDRPASGRRPGTATKRTAKRDEPTNIGSLEDEVAKLKTTSNSASAYPKARGLVETKKR